MSSTLSERKIFFSAWDNSRRRYNEVNVKVAELKEKIKKISKQITSLKASYGFKEKIEELWEELKPLLNKYRSLKESRKKIQEACKYTKNAYKKSE